MNFTNPLDLRKFVAPEFITGKDSATLAGRYARNLGGERVLLVTDAGVIESGWADATAASLREYGHKVTLFSDISPNPRDTECMQGADIYRQNDCNAIVAVGGGSPMDAAKGIGIVVTNDRHVLEFEGVDNVPRPGPPLICLPTTSGSSADVSQFAIILDSVRKVKIAIVSKAVVPDASLLDPQLTSTMPPDLTAHTGLDALTHAIEAYVSNASSPITDIFALEAVRAIRSYLPRCMEHPADLEARAGMQLGSLYAGLAFSNAILGAVHALAHSLGGLMDLPHGQCNAILLEHVIAHNFSAAPERYARIGAALGASLDSEMGQDEQCETITETIRQLKHRVGVDQTLSSLGVARDDLPGLARFALDDPCMATNPKSLTEQEVTEIYAQAL
ncbi:Alcohol dehydrogenase, class IV [Paucidesulfovibrio gracilis DSM 16080]|uniref:Alcohol dehydrogenase, class IV n=1 Tax=Paucidesulfovibrio gracilis DSM 16080 TaxID=1121449 RepID=A0A1T4W998_9BACT|nr:alcohol dehydrogenase-like regulatory protein ErcA [Paucidesulfovibrio gracilis]SKA73618.1 Alcohol dehydrogenase, class IV [Paucidesulfovibrio gracilis DSM 16080]